ncbi:phage integrase N-terminal SAM-like domain-containing protein, partial [Pseudidiomarina fusca]
MPIDRLCLTHDYQKSWMLMMASPFIEKLRADMRLRGYSLKTEKSYLGWIRQFIYFHKKRHPIDMGAEEVKAFLSWLA